MTDKPRLHRLAPHDPLPEIGAYVLVIRHFGEDDPTVRLVDITVSQPEGDATRPALRADGTPMGLDEAIVLGVRRAAGAGIADVYVVDRTAGPREQEVVQRGGDHSFSGDALADDDADEGRHGADMRDRRP
jgi:hypothetical protein